MIAVEDIPLVRLRWSPGFRIVPTRYPTINLFDRVADASDFDALHDLEAMTNDRLRDELGVIELVPRAERIFGAGAGPIMAAFTHLNPSGSRFSDGSYGVFYAALDRDTAIEETKYHHARFLAATNEAPLRLAMRLYAVSIDAELHDLRALDDASIYDPDDYTHSQSLGRRLRRQAANGVSFRSVRRVGGECVGLFRPRCASACVHAAYLWYEWDGAAFSGVYARVDG